MSLKRLHKDAKSKADRMLNALGFELFLEDSDTVIYTLKYENGVDNLLFYKDSQFYDYVSETESSMTVKLHLAIHEKLKELGNLEKWG